MREPAVKGSIFATVLEDVVCLRDQGRIGEDEIHAHLDPEEIGLLDTKANPAAWYPMSSYAHLLELLGATQGRSKPGYFAERGARNARRLMEQGLYQQLDFIGRWKEEAAGRRERGERALAAYLSNMKLVVTLASSIYSVGRWEAERDPEYPGRVSIVVRGAEPYSEAMRLAAEGFLNECARGSARLRRADLYTSERPAPDRIIFRMNFDVDDLAEA